MNIKEELNEQESREDIQVHHQDVMICLDQLKSYNNSLNLAEVTDQ